MPPTFFTTADKRKADSDIWAQQARSRLADAWEQNARLRLPNLIGEAQQKLNQVLQPDLANASAAPTLPAAAAPVASPTPQTQVPPLAASGAGGDYTDAIRQAAQRYGVDPETALRVAQSEGGTGSGASGDSGSSFGPFQLHYGNVAGGGNAVAGLGDEFTRQTGLDARDPASTTAAIDFALKHASQQGWGVFHGAARVGIGDQQGIGGQQAAGVAAPAGQPASRTSQFNMGLDAGDAYSFCGPAAAIAFANSYGRFPTVDEAKQLAQKYGWTPQAGMAGIQSEQKLLTEGLGIPTKLEPQVNWQHVAQDAGSGNPVIISTPGHYFYVTGFDASSGRYNVNTSGTDLKGGSSWMTSDEMQQRMGSAQGALYADNPQSPGDSIAKGVGDLFSGLGSAAKGIGDALSNPGRIKDAAGEALSGFQAQARNANQPSAQSPPGTLGTPNTAPTPTAQSMLSGAKDFLTEEQPWMRNVVYGTQKQASADLGISPLEPGTQQPTQAEKYATARGMATGLAQTLVPEDLIARAATTGAGSLAKSAEIGKDVARSKMPAEAEVGFAMGMPKPPTGAPPVPPAVEPHGLTINLPKYTPPEVRDVIQQAYDAHPEIMDAARRGVIPDEVVKDLAAQVGTNAQRISNLWKPGQAKNAETILALRQALADESQSVVAAQQRVKTAPTDLGAQQALIQALTRHASIQETVTGVTAEAGRALRQFRQPVEGTQATLQGLQRLAKQWKVTPEELAGAIAKADLSDPVAVAGLARNLVKHSPGDYLSALWYFGLLSSPLTHIRNVVSNSITAAVAPLESLPAATMDVARSVATGAPRERYFGESSARYVGLAAGMREGMTNALQIFTRGFTDAQAAGKLENVAAVREPFLGAVGKVINAPGRALGAEDAFFRTINQTASLYGQAYRIASQEGLKGKALAERVTQLRISPTTEMLAAAEQEGTYRVFQQGGQFVSWASQMPGAMRFLVPFVKTPYNIAKYTMQYSPLGFATPAVERLQGTARTIGQREDQLARASIGSAIMGGLVLYAADGNITGAAPNNANERDAFQRQHPAYSIKIGDSWHSYQAMQPFSSLFAVAAAINDAQDRGLRLEPAAAFTMGAFAVAKSLTDMPWLQGFTQALEAQQDPQKMAGAYAQHVAGSMVPGAALWRWVERATDGMVRDPNSIPEGVMAGVPGASALVRPRQDAFGKDVQRPGGQTGLVGTVNIFNSAPVKDDPVEKALADLQIHGFTVEPGFVGDKMSVKGIPAQATLTTDEQRQVQRVGGQLAYGLLLTMVTSPGWQKASPELRAKAVNDVVSKTREYARAQLIPQVAPRAIAALQGEMATGVRKPAPKPAGVP